MKSISLFLLLVVATLAFSGCSSCPEDKAFFEQNWKHPGKLDEHMS